MFLTAIAVLSVLMGMIIRFGAHHTLEIGAKAIRTVDVKTILKILIFPALFAAGTPLAFLPRDAKWPTRT